MEVGIRKDRERSLKITKQVMTTGVLIAVVREGAEVHRPRKVLKRHVRVEFLVFANDSLLEEVPFTIEMNNGALIVGEVRYCAL
jgi:hypothetical protein